MRSEVLGAGTGGGAPEQLSKIFACHECRREERTVKCEGFCAGERRADLLVGGELTIELKSVERHAAVRVAQVISYLKAFDQPLGLLITFNVALLKKGIRRVVNGRR